MGRYFLQWFACAFSRDVSHQRALIYYVAALSFGFGFFSSFSFFLFLSVFDFVFVFNSSQIFCLFCSLFSAFHYAIEQYHR